jgi:hypothetical protein
MSQKEKSSLAGNTTILIKYSRATSYIDWLSGEKTNVSRTISVRVFRVLQQTDTTGGPGVFCYTMSPWKLQFLTLRVAQSVATHGTYKQFSYVSTIFKETKVVGALFHVLTAASMKMTACWKIALCSLLEVDRRLIAVMMDVVRSSEMSDYSTILRGTVFQKAVISKKVVVPCPGLS